MASDRLSEKSELYFQLGRLFGPLLDLIEHPDWFDGQDKSETLARYYAEYGSLLSRFRTFTVGQPGHDYQVEFEVFSGAVQAVPSGIRGGLPLDEVILSALNKARSALDAIPIPRTSVILEAGSPFTAYRKLRDLCEADATTAITWLDPYMGASIFRRYILGVRRDVPVCLVVSAPGPTAGRRDRDRWDEFLDVSRLYAAEFGPDRYRLVVQPQLHDRWVVLDEKRIYALGGSAKDAGNRDYFTISAVESTPANLAGIKAHIDTGEEWFGPDVTTHR